jgi:hypothetical protein
LCGVRGLGRRCEGGVVPPHFRRHSRFQISDLIFQSAERAEDSACPLWALWFKSERCRASALPKSAAGGGFPLAAGEGAENEDEGGRFQFDQPLHVGREGEAASAGVDAADVAAVAGDGAFVVEVFWAMVGEFLDEHGGVDGPDIAAPGGEFRARRGFEHEIEVRGLDAFMSQDHVSKEWSWHCRCYRPDASRVRSA